MEKTKAELGFWKNTFFENPKKKVYKRWIFFENQKDGIYPERVNFAPKIPNIKAFNLTASTTITEKFYLQDAETEYI